MKKRLILLIAVLGSVSIVTACEYITVETTGEVSNIENIEESDDVESDEISGEINENADDIEADVDIEDIENSNYEVTDDDFETISETVVDADYESNTLDIHFKNSYRLDEHYEKHGIEMGFASAEEYEAAAAMVVSNPNSLHKLEAEDGDDVYYLEETNEFVIVSGEGYIRTYFNPSAGIDYYNRQ